MSHNTRLRSGATLTVALALILSMIAAPAAAAPSTVTTASNTVPGEPTSTISDGTTIDPFNGSSNVTETIVFNTSSNASAASHVTIAANDTGQTVLDQDAVNVTPTSLGAAADEQWRLNFTHADLMELERDAGENVSVDVLLANQTGDYVNQSYTNITIHVQNDNATAVRYVDQTDVDNGDAEVSENEPLLGLWGEATNTSTVEQSSVGIDGDSTDVYVVYADSETSSTFADARETTGLLDVFGSNEEGDLLAAHQASVAGTPTAVYLESAPDPIEDSMTYGVATTVDGNEATMLSLGESYSDENQVDVTTTGNDKWDLRTRLTGLQGHSVTQSIPVVSAAPVLGGA